MTKFEPEYIKYSSRIVRGLSGSLIAVVFLTVLVFIGDLQRFWLYALIFAGVFVAISSIMVVRKSRICVTAIIFSGQHVEIQTVDKDIPQLAQKFLLDKTRIKVTELFFNFNRWGRNFKLQIDSEQNGKYQPVIEQYEIGKWNLDLFKQVYSKYCQEKNIPISVSGLKRTNF